MNYFSPEPKKRKEDFFDMEYEWSALDRALKKRQDGGSNRSEEIRKDLTHHDLHE